VTPGPSQLQLVCQLKMNGFGSQLKR